MVHLFLCFEKKDMSIIINSRGKIYEKNIIKEKHLKKCCANWEFNMGVCAGGGKRLDNSESTYGMPIDETIEMFPNGCEGYGISLDAFIKEEKLNGR